MRKTTFLFFWLLATVPFPAKADVNLVELVKEVQPAVVTILTYDKEKKPLSQGTGFFINEKGHLITNYHVLKGAYSATVRTFDGKEFPVKLVLAENEVVDLIKLSVDVPEETVRFIQVAKTVPEVAERIIVVGSPLGLEQTVSEGIVSAVRDIPTIGKIFQISAPISSGSSGSPVVNMEGQVIGIATFQLIEGQNLNFAVSNEQILSLRSDQNETTLSSWSVLETEVADTNNMGSLLVIEFLLWSGEYEEALHRIKAIIDKDVNNVTAWWYMGNYYTKIGQDQDALKAYMRTLRINPDLAEVYFNLGIIYSRLKRYQNAIEALKQAIRIKPNFADAHLHLGVGYELLGSNQKAIKHLKQAIKIKPNDADAHYFLGIAYTELRRFREALKEYKEVIRIKPDYADPYLKLGRIYVFLNHHKKAIETFKQAIRINPDDTKGHFGLGISYLGIGDKGSALDEYKILKTLDKEKANELFNLIYE